MTGETSAADAKVNRPGTRLLVLEEMSRMLRRIVPQSVELVVKLAGEAMIVRADG